MKKLYVVKVGTSSLTDESGALCPEKLAEIARQLCEVRQRGNSVILVSSGAVAAGFRRLGFSKRPDNLADRQASAAVGQGLLMEEYTRCFWKYKTESAQLLLTRSDFTDRRRYKNIFSTLSVLINRGAIPVINENDSVAVEELKLGNNDILASQVASMLHANMLILLTDVDGLYTANPHKDSNAKHIDAIASVTDDVLAMAQTTDNANGTGGMITKLQAAEMATYAGVPVFICSSDEKDSIIGAVDGTTHGTIIEARENALKTKKQWLAFYAQSQGNIYVDAGAADALTINNKSLLMRGVVAVEGDFKAGDVVSVYRQGTHEYLGRGVTNLARDTIFDRMHSDDNSEVINRDNWVGTY